MKNTGSENYGGPVVTAGGLVFIARHELRPEVPRVRQGDRRAAVGGDAAVLRQRDAGHLRGRRPAVHCRAGRRRTVAAEHAAGVGRDVCRVRDSEVVFEGHRFSSARVRLMHVTVRHVLERRARGVNNRAKIISACSAISALIVVTLGAAAQPPAPAPTPPAPQRRMDYPTRPPGDPAAIERGKALYSVNCEFCHGADTRGGDGGPSLLRSALVLDDQHGELMAPVLTVRTAGYAEVHVHRRAGRPTSPRSFTPSVPPATTSRASSRRASSSATRRPARRSSTRSARRAIRRPAICEDLATKISDPRLLQQTWLMPGTGGGRGGPPPVAVAPATVTVTLPSGEKVDGELDRIDDFIVTLTTAGRHRAVVPHQRRHAEGRGPRSASAAPRSAAGVHRRGHPQRDGLPGDIEMMQRLARAKAFALRR